MALLTNLFLPQLNFIFLMFIHKQITDWKPTFFFFSFVFSEQLQQQSWYRSSVTGVIRGMAFTVGGV